MSGRNETAGFLGSDPTVFYVNDTLQLVKLPLAKWPAYVFWAPPKGDVPAELPAALAAYNTYTSKGLPPGPICTPTVDSIDGALAPDTRGDYLYFFATKDGRTVFAKTYAAHLKNIAKYGGS
jgi:cell division protein YceG involved in septum cleavage